MPYTLLNLTQAIHSFSLFAAAGDGVRRSKDCRNWVSNDWRRRRFGVLPPIFPSVSAAEDGKQWRSLANP
jgi:hypothetical protein